MGERIHLRMDSDFRMEVLSLDPHRADVPEMQRVTQLHQLTPYGMMLAGLAACTGLVVLTYAQNRDLLLEAVILAVRYERVFDEDCVNCEQIEQYEEQIIEAITFEGALSPGQRERLFRVAHQCPIHKMYEQGIAIEATLAEALPEEQRTGE